LFLTENEFNMLKNVFLFLKKHENDCKLLLNIQIT